jgi:hypothetical protein
MWPCIEEDTPVKDRDVGYLTCHAIADIALQRGDGDGCAEVIVLTMPHLL